MNDYLIQYHVTLTTKSTVFIGSGRKLSKKEYILLKGNTEIGVFDDVKLYSLMKRKFLSDKFEDFLAHDNKGVIRYFLSDNNVKPNEYSECFRYRISSGDTFVDKDVKINDVREFMMDPYGLPYVPGSSVKGMLRTILITEDILKNKEKYKGVKDNVLRVLDSYDKIKKNSFLKKETSEIETIALRTLKRNEDKKSDAVNDVLSGMIVSDSKPLSLEDLTVCKDIEYHKDGAEKQLNAAWISLKPGSRIRFTITIDRTLCKFDKDYILNAARDFADSFSENFSLRFEGADRLLDNEVILGGGSGFVSKTILYPLLGHDDGLKLAQKFFRDTTTSKHKHEMDLRLGVSPHILKCTHYEGQTYEMGICEITFD